jgi:hypothetical protein
VKRLIAFLSLFAMASLPACSPIGEGTRESCVGPYTGTFEVTSRDYGPLEGRILANFAAPDVQTVEPALNFTLTFDTETAEDIPDMPQVGNVAETGEVTRRSGSFDFEGTFNLDDCEASGTFSADPIYTDGTWRISNGHSAY